MLQLSSRRYSLPLRQPLTVGASTIEYREGMLIALEDDAGRVGWGDAAPLPGLHEETVEHVEAGLARLGDELRALDADDGPGLRRRLQDLGAPSVAFGLDGAWMHLQAARRGCAAAELLTDGPRAEVEVNALVTGGVRDARRALETGALQGYPTVKLKVGRRDLDEERTMLKLLLDELPDGIPLRLDGNRGLSLADACALLDGVEIDRIEYLEEPLRNPGELSALHERSGVPIALDESLLDRDESAHTARGVTAWVLKPSLHGGLFESLAIAERAAGHDISCVVSSCFESGLGLWALAQLAASTPKAVPAGLGTDVWLADDVIEPPFRSSNGRIALADAVSTPRAATEPDA